MIQQAIHDVTERKNLDFDTAKQVMGEIMNGEATQAQMASFLTGLRMKGESIEEITACAAVMREKALKLTPSFDVIDIVGTGGDEVGTFNISTTPQALSWWPRAAFRWPNTATAACPARAGPPTCWNSLA